MRRAQFFISTIVLISLTIVLTILNLYIPKEIDVNNERITNTEILNAEFVKETISGISDYFRINWLRPYTHRTIIKIHNNFTIKDQTVYASIDLPNNIYINSLKLFNNEGFNVPFNIEWINEGRREGIIFFQANNEALTENSYYLYYNKAPGKVIPNEKQDMIIYNETNELLSITTGNYKAIINKSNGGIIQNLSIADSPNFLTSLGIDSVIGCESIEYNLYSASNKNVTVTNKNYYVKAVFTGSRFANETYKITELFLPDRIILIDESTFAQESPCNYFGIRASVNRSLLMNYFDSNKLMFEPTPAGGKMYTSTLWTEIYSNFYSLGFALPHQMILGLNATTNENNGDYRLINNTSPGISKGTHVNNVSVIPLINHRLNNTKSFVNPAVSVIHEDLDTEVNNLFNSINKYFYDINALVNYDNEFGVFHEYFFNLSNWNEHSGFRDYFTAQGNNNLGLLEARIKLVKYASPASISLYAPNKIPYQVSTNNYAAKGSDFKGLINSSILVFSPDTKDLNITFNTPASGFITYPRDLNYNGINRNSLLAYWKFNNNTFDETGLNKGILYGDTVGLWNFNEGSGSTAYDSTAYNRNGTITGATWTQGIHERALIFNGDTDYVTIPNLSPSFDLLHNNSVSVWFKTKGLSAYTWQRLLDHFTGGTPGAGWYLGFCDDNAKLCVEYRSATDSCFLQTTGKYNDSQWHNAILTINETHCQLYIDGTLNVTDTHSTLIAHTSGLSIGNRGFNGTIDEVAIYNRTLSQDEILDLYNSGKAKMIEYVPGKYEEGIELKGKMSEYLTANVNLNGASNFTVGGWYYPKEYFSQGSFSGALLLSTSPDNYAFGLGPEYGNFCFTVRGANNLLNYSCAGGNAFLSLQNKWSFIVGVREGNSLKLYINGVLNKSITDDNIIRTLTTTQIGIGQGWARKFNGTIDEVFIYNRSLSASEINSLYTNTAPYYTNPSKVSLDADNLIGYWNFNTESNKTEDLAYANHGTLYGDTILLLHFDEGSGTYTKDESTYNNYGIINGATWTQGIYENALSFNTTNDCVNISNSNFLNLGNKNLTIIAWVKTLSNNTKSIISKKGWNQVIYSEEFNNPPWWNYCSSGITVINTTDVIAPDGTYTAEKITTQTGCSSNISGRGQNIPTAPNSKYTISIWARGAEGGEFFVLSPEDLVGCGVYYLTTDWKEYKCTFTSSASPNRGFQFYVNSYDDQKTFYVWGAQRINGTQADIYSKTDSLAINEQGYNLWVSNNTIKTSIGYNDSLISTNSSISQNDWHQITVVYDRNANMSLFIDGQKKNSIDISTLIGIDIANNSPLIIGGTSYGSINSLISIIDEVAIYNRTLTDNEVLDLYNLGRAKMIEYVDGLENFGNAIHFNGKNNFINTSISDNLNIRDEITINLWAKPGIQNSPTSGRNMIAGYYGSDNRIRLWIQPGNQVYVEAFDGTNWINTPKARINHDEWTLLTAKYDKAKLYLYVNEQEYKTNAYNNQLYTLKNSIMIGGHDATGDRYFNGSIDEVRVYNKSLSINEIRTLYTSSPYYTRETGNSTITLSNTQESGFYNLTINNEANISSSAPKLIATLPLKLNNTSPVYLLINESVTTLNLNITTYTSNPINFTLYNNFNELIAFINTTSIGSSIINKPVIPCYKECVYKLDINGTGNYKLESTNIKYASSAKEYIINPEEPEITIISANNIGDYNKYHAYYNTNQENNNELYTSDLTYSLSAKQINNSYYSIDLDDIKLYYKGTEWFGTRGWTSCTDSCTNTFSEVRFIELGTERVVAWLNTSVGLEYYFEFYPSTPFFKVKTSKIGNHSFGPGWKVNNTDDLYYEYKNSIIHALGDTNKYVSKFNITGPLAYAKKSDDSCSASVILYTNALEAKESIKINDTAIIINAYLPSEYFFIINENPNNYLSTTTTQQEGTRITYSYETSELKIEGTLYE